MAQEVAEPRARDLSGEEKRRLAMLGLPTFGLALAITTVSTYLPKVAEQFTHSTIAIGAIVGGEGIMALWVPLVVGPWSDRLRTRLGGRLPFLLGGVPILAGALVAMGLLGSMGGVAVAAGVFFLAYFLSYEPYRALYPDLLDDEVAGRAQSTQAMWRGAGTGCALLAGGLLLSSARLAPFALAALVALAATGAFAAAAVKQGLEHLQAQHEQEGPAAAARRLYRLLWRHPALRLYLAANALWELALAALKAFVVLYLTRGLGLSLVVASVIVGGTGVLILAGAAAAGKLGDRFGPLRVIEAALPIYGLGFAVPAFCTFKPLPRSCRSSPSAAAR